MYGRAAPAQDRRGLARRAGLWMIDPMPAHLYGFGDPCLPTRVPVAPRGSLWLHEIKHDGYRLMVRRTAAGVRIRTRNGHDWTDRFPLIVEASGKLRATSFVIDGEGVILRACGVSDFDRLNSRRHDGEVQLLGFDLLELDGSDLCRDPLTTRKATLASLLRRSLGWHPVRRAHRGHRRRDRVRARLQARAGGHRVEAARLGLLAGPVTHVAQGEEPGEPGDAARVGGRPALIAHTKKGLRLARASRQQTSNANIRCNGRYPSSGESSTSAKDISNSALPPPSSTNIDQSRVASLEFRINSCATTTA
jgi:ATP dependent DNA ligase domain